LFFPELDDEPEVIAGTRGMSPTALIVADKWKCNPKESQFCEHLHSAKQRVRQLNESYLKMQTNFTTMPFYISGVSWT
jgi:hypothetical protein